MKIYKVLKVNLIISLMTLIPFLLSAILGMILREKIYTENIFEIIETLTLFVIVIFVALFAILNILCLPIYIYELFSKTKTVINKQYIDTKESIYTRELPDKYNSVIAGEILDLKSRFKEEYVAGVLELISKGYIIENDNTLVINNNKLKDNLLKNEKYILDTFDKINNETYLKYSYEFFKTVQEDMLDLGLYKDIKFLKNIKNRIKYIFKKIEENNTDIGLLLFVTLFVLMLGFVFNFKLMFFFTLILYIILIIMIRKNKLTKKGEIEKEKIGKLKLFFDKETNFKDKTKEERKIWGRYSAFAVALGVNGSLKEEIIIKVLKKE